MHMKCPVSGVRLITKEMACVGLASPVRRLQKKAWAIPGGTGAGGIPHLRQQLLSLRPQPSFPIVIGRQQA